jgi:hypothetical protein
MTPVWRYVIVFAVVVASIVAAAVASELHVIRALKDFFAALGYLVFWHLLPVTCCFMEAYDCIRQWQARRKVRWLVRHGFTFMGQISEHLLPEDER